MPDEIVLLDHTVQVSASHVTPDTELARLEVPLLSHGEAGSVDTLATALRGERGQLSCYLGDVDTLGQLADILQRSLDTVED